MLYNIASPDQYLAITGAGIDTVKICKSTWVLPFQKVSVIESYDELSLTITVPTLQHPAPGLHSEPPGHDTREASIPSSSCLYSWS
jgi:hypothetical protein